MAIITVYVKRDSERRRPKKGHVMAIVAVLAMAIGAAGAREPQLLATETAAPLPVPQFVEKIVYVDRPAPAPAAAPTPPPPQPPTRTPPAKPTRRAPPPPPVRTASAPLPEQPVITPPPAPPPRLPRRLLIEPRNLHFVRGGSARVAVYNPNDAAITVTGIRIPTGTGISGFTLQGEEQCVRTLDAGERCHFSIEVARNAVGTVEISIDHDG